MTTLPWNERVVMLSINPDAATRDDVTKMAADLMEAYKTIDNLEQQLGECENELINLEGL